MHNYFSAAPANFDWTNDRIERLKELYQDGTSFGLIARDLGTTRCSAIGKAHRLGLWRGKHGNGHTFVPKKRIPPHSNGQNLNRLFARVKAVQLPLVDLEPELVSDPISFFDLNPHHCRWPVSGEGLTIMFCGAEKFGEESYCAHHYRIAHLSRSNRMTEAELELNRRRMAKVRKAKAA